MTQSTPFAQVATNLLNLLQGYTKGIRFTAILTLLFTIGVGQIWGAEKTETISWNTSTSSGTGATLTITWTANTSCTITQAKGDNTSNNVNTSYAASPRWYQYHHITFTPKTGYTIKKVLLTGSSSTYNGQDMTFVEGSGTISKSGNATTITGAWTSSFKIKMGKQFRPESVVVTYEEAVTNFTVGETVFIQALSNSAWDASACVKAWFNGNNTAATTYWLYDATGSDAGKKMFATIVPSGTSSKVQIQRFASNCSDWWNSNGDLNKSDGAETNILQTYGASENNVAWNSGGLQLYLYGTPNSWASSLATFSDKSNGVWTATYSNYSPTTTSADFKIKDSYNGWIGNTGSNDNATLSGMVVGSTYDITATLDITTHSLTISKELKKCKVHFNMNGHGTDIASKTNVTPNSTITAPTAPTDTDYKFEGWFKDANCTTAWNFSTDKVTETMTLYAKWTKKVTYTITWKVNKQTYTTGTPTTTIYEGSTYKNLNLPTAPADGTLDDCYTGKKFVGWSTTNIGSAESDKPSILFKSTSEAPNTAITENTTLYAVFATESTTGGGTVNTTASVTIANYADSKSWSNETRYTSVIIDNNVTASVSSGTNTGKYYTSDDTWRLYANESGKLTISTSEGSLSSITLTFNTKDNGKISYNSTALTSGSSVSVSGTSATFSVGSTSGDKGKVFIKSISVTYTTTGESTTETTGYVTECCTLNNITLDGNGTTTGGTSVKISTFCSAGFSGAGVGAIPLGDTIGRTNSGEVSQALCFAP